MSPFCFPKISEKMGVDLTAFPKSVVCGEIFNNVTEIESCDLQPLITYTCVALTRVLFLVPSTLSLQEALQVL